MALAPVLNPFYNLSKILKECTLLEDHLRDPKERCADCITKHSTKIAALFEEAQGLDVDGNLPDLNGFAEIAEEICDAYDAGADPLVLASQVREMRKAVVPIVKHAKRTGLLPTKNGASDPREIFSHIPGGAGVQECPTGACGIKPQSVTPTEEMGSSDELDDIELELIAMELG